MDFYGLFDFFQLNQLSSWPQTDRTVGVGSVSVAVGHRFGLRSFLRNFRAAKWQC